MSDSSFQRVTRALPILVGAVVLALSTACTGGSSPPATSPAEAAASPAGDGGWHYALIIDASSSGSTLFIYQWRKSGDRRLPWVEAAPFPREPGASSWSKRVKPGLSAYVGRPAEAAASLEPLIEYALEKIGDDPGTLARTSLLAMGTAGVRPLPPDQRGRILEAVRTYLATTPFGSASARVITGTEEGVYGWIAVNYLLGHLEHGGPFPTVGALDLGGASTQITFEPLDHPRDHAQVVELGGQSYHLYSYSYLGLGQDEARDRVASPACFPGGYPIPEGTWFESGALGTGDWDSCRQAILEELAASCDREPCSLFGVYQPPLYGDFLAFSAYAYAASFFGLEGPLSPASLEPRGRAFCSRSWEEMIAEDPEVAENPYVPLYCFSAAYIVTLLSDAFGFPETTERVNATLQVQGVDVGWALGALLSEIAGSGD